MQLIHKHYFQDNYTVSYRLASGTSVTTACSQITVMSCTIGSLTSPGGSYVVIVTANSQLEQNQAQNVGNPSQNLFTIYEVKIYANINYLMV